MDLNNQLLGFLLLFLVSSYSLSSAAAIQVGISGEDGSGKLLNMKSFGETRKGRMVIDVLDYNPPGPNKCHEPGQPPCPPSSPA